MTAKPFQYRPCPECDGWLMACSRIFSATGDGYYETFIEWGCTVCSHTEELQDRDVPVEQMSRSHWRTGSAADV